MNILHFVSTLILMACIVMLVIVNRRMARAIRQYARDQVTRLNNDIDMETEIGHICYNPIVGRGLISSSRWKIDVIGRQLDYIVIARRERRWNENNPRIPIIMIKRFGFDPSDTDAKEYAKNCAEELADKLNEDCEI